MKQEANDICDPTLGTEKAHESAVKDVADDECGNRYERFGPEVSWVFGLTGDTESDKDRVAYRKSVSENSKLGMQVERTGLHACKTAPGSIRNTIDQTTDEATDYEDDICSLCVNVGSEVSHEIFVSDPCQRALFLA